METTSAAPSLENEEDEAGSSKGAGNSPTGTYRQEKRKRRNTAVLVQWIEEHPYNPYPTKSEKQNLAFMAGMTLRQLNDWFANARRNIKKMGLENWRKKRNGNMVAGELWCDCACSFELQLHTRVHARRSYVFYLRMQVLIAWRTDKPDLTLSTGWFRRTTWSQTRPSRGTSAGCSQQVLQLRPPG